MRTRLRGSWTARMMAAAVGAMLGSTWISTAATVPVRAGRIFGSHMVLQHGRPIEVWGDGPAGELVTVELGSEAGTTTVDTTGRWSVRLPARSPSAQPVQLRINATVFDDVLVGDVWLGSGQSNMAFGLKLTPRGKTDRVAAGNPLVRVAHHSALRLRANDGYSREELARCNPRDFFACQWLTDADPGMAEASAVAWYFGHSLQPRLGIPIGVIVVALGGSALNNWIPAAELRRFPDTASLFTQDWLTHPDVKPLHQSRARDAFKPVLEPGQRYLAGQMPYRWMCEPAFLFEAGIEALRPLGLRGVLWYQGESDASDERSVVLATTLLPMLVRAWRVHFSAPELPWLSVQLPAHEPPHWPAFRELQRKATEQVGHAALAVTIDLGDKGNVHPADKRPVGERLARLAWRHVYGHTGEALFPGVKEAERSPGGIRLRLNECPGGLLPVAGPIAGFEVADKNGSFAPAAARLVQPDTIEIISEVRHPALVRYLWAGFPDPRPQIFNREKLPLGPFRLRLPAGGR